MAIEFEPLPIRVFGPGDVVFRQGDAGNEEAYLIHKGTVQVRRQQGGREHVLRTLRKGDMLGEIALFRDAPHSATAVALDAVALLVIPANRLEYLVRTHPGLAIALIRQLARMAAGNTSDPGRDSAPPS